MYTCLIFRIIRWEKLSEDTALSHLQDRFPDVVPAGDSTGPADPAVLKFPRSIDFADPAVLKFPRSIDLADLAVRNRVFAAESFKVSGVSDQHYFLESAG